MTEPVFSCSFTATLWRWRARTTEPGAWCFVTVPPGPSREIRELTDGFTRGFGSVRVAVEVGTTRWQTSVFPDGGSGCYVLPVKRAVRVAEGVSEDDDLTVTLTLRDAG